MKILLLTLMIPLNSLAFDGGISDSGLCENCVVVMPNFDTWTTIHDASSDAGRRQRRRSDGGSVAPPPEGGCSCGTTNIGELTFLAFLMFMISASYEFRNILTSRRRK